MKSETIKGKPLSKKETKGLLSLIEGSKIINYTKTNATNNKMKIDEWNRISDIFNASIGSSHRTPQQLRLKWENLKKKLRKRSAVIRMERIKTGGGPPSYFPPDDILDRVAALLGSTGKDLSVMIGGDAKTQLVDDGGSDGTVTPPVLGDRSPTPMLWIDSPLPATVNPPAIPTNITPVGNNTPVLNNKRHLKSRGAKQKLLEPDDGCLATNMAMAKYFENKTKFLETQNENLRLQNQKVILDMRSSRRLSDRRINSIIYMSI